MFPPMFPCLCLLQDIHIFFRGCISFYYIHLRFPTVTGHDSLDCFTAKSHPLIKSFSRMSVDWEPWQWNLKTVGEESLKPVSWTLAVDKPDFYCFSEGSLLLALFSFPENRELFGVACPPQLCYQWGYWCGGVAMVFQPGGMLPPVYSKIIIGKGTFFSSQRE